MSCANSNIMDIHKWSPEVSNQCEWFHFSMHGMSPMRRFFDELESTFTLFSTNKTIAIAQSTFSKLHTSNCDGNHIIPRQMISIKRLYTTPQQSNELWMQCSLCKQPPTTCVHCPELAYDEYPPKQLWIWQFKFSNQSSLVWVLLVYTTATKMNMCMMRIELCVRYTQ